MKVEKILALAILAGTCSTGWACSTPPSNPNDPGGGTGETPPDCTVTWDFTGDRPSGEPQLGDPLTYTSLSDPDGTSYSLNVRGFAIQRRNNDHDNETDSGYNPNTPGLGEIVDTAGQGSTGTYATDRDPTTSDPNYALGVHAPGESDHWGTKIDNVKSNGESWWYRDAVLLEFENCVVSLDEISLQSAYSGQDTDFELWAYTGTADLDFSGEDISAVLPGYMTWDDPGSVWTQIEENNGNSTPVDSPRDVQISNTIESTYFVLIAGTSNNQWDDGFRVTNLVASCDAANCGSGGSTPSGETPVPGTLALLAIGALATRRRLMIKAR